MPDELELRLRELARETGMSLNSIVIQRLTYASLVAGPPYDDLDWFVGSAGDEFATEQLEAATWLDELPREF